MLRTAVLPLAWIHGDAVVSAAERSSRDVSSQSAGCLCDRAVDPGTPFQSAVCHAHLFVSVFAQGERGGFSIPALCGGRRGKNEIRIGR